MNTTSIGHFVDTVVLLTKLRLSLFPLLYVLTIIIGM